MTAVSPVKPLGDSAVLSMALELMRDASVPVADPTAVACATGSDRVWALLVEHTDTLDDADRPVFLECLVSLPDVPDSVLADLVARYGMQFRGDLVVSCALKSPCSGPQTLAAVVEHMELSVCELTTAALVQHPDLTSDQALKVLAGDLAPRVVRELAARSDMGEAVELEIVDRGYRPALLEVASRSSASPAALAALVPSGDPSVLTRVCTNPSSPTDALVRVAVDRHAPASAVGAAFKQIVARGGVAELVAHL